MLFKCDAKVAKLEMSPSSGGEQLGTDRRLVAREADGGGDQVDDVLHRGGTQEVHAFSAVAHPADCTQAAAPSASFT